MAVIVLLAMTASCLGWGMAGLRLAGPAAGLSRFERLAWAPVLGMGLSGWIMFPACLLLGVGPAAAMLTTALGLLLLAFLRADLADQAGFTPPTGPSGALTWTLIAILVSIGVMDLANALVPPVDADSIAYHFALPKRFLAEGHLRFVPQAVEAAIPLLLHMTYLQALALGGEQSLTLWCGITSWGLPLASFALVRRYLPLTWALVLVIAIKSMPAVVYGAPAGQIEVRLASLFLVGVTLSARARIANSWRIALTAGLAAGLCAGAKYSGLVAPAVCGLALLGGPRRFPAIVTFGLAALVSGGQWYAWNWIHTGDPLFPMLWGKLPYSPGAYWDEEMMGSFRSYLTNEVSVPKTVFWLLYYPVKATFDGMPIFESGRTGFGPLAFVLLPFAAAGLLARKEGFRNRELAIVGAVCVAGYILWFLGGSSQRVRHFLAEFVPFLIILTAAAYAASRRHPRLVPPLAAGLAATLAIQLAGLTIFSLPAIRFLLGNDDRQAYLAHNVSAYPVVKWLNTNLGSDHRVLLTNRELVYHLEIPSLYLPPSYDGRIRLGSLTPSSGTWIQQFKTLGVTHLLIGNLPHSVKVPRLDTSFTLERMAARFIENGCGEVAARVTTPPLLQSRTLRLTSTTEPEVHLVVTLRLESCDQDRLQQGDSISPPPRL